VLATEGHVRVMLQRYFDSMAGRLFLLLLVGVMGSAIHRPGNG